MKKTIYYLLLGYLFALAAFNVSALRSAYADCPGCFENETPMAGHTPTGGGRPYYAIYMDSSATANPVYSNALNAAMTQWNNAPGTAAGSQAPVSFRQWSGNPNDPLPQIVLKIEPLGTNKKGEKICGRLTAQSYPSSPGTIINYVLTLPPEAATWTQDRIRDVIAHELGHALGVDDVNQGCTSVMQQSSSDCKTSVHSGVERRDVDAAIKYATNRADCDEERGDETQTGDPGGGDGDPCGGDPCCGDPYCGDPCQGDPCCYDPYCGDPCRGDPNCGQECHTVCTQVCTTECTVWDDYGYCYWYEQVCDPPECHVEC
ncbi:MAG TPA: hypothetical protein VD968_16790, partial [Pyrinomonadaceae bacterium]|nr:hypothetical protein [Pyrinomonadaceae bacterium]